MADEFDPLTGELLPRANPAPAAPVQPQVLTGMTKEEWNALADTKLQELLQTSSGALLLAVIRESKDRIEGKPGQAITFDANLRVVNVNASIEFVKQPVVIEGQSTNGNALQVIENE